MNKIKYRILALLLCFVMVLSSFSGTPVEAANQVTVTGTYTTDALKSLTLTQTVEGYEVVLTADEGVLPTDAVMSASLIKSSAATQKIETAIEKEMNAGKKLEETIAFDITIFDKDGKEIQPDTDNGNVTVTFHNIETNQSTTEAEVFHVQDDYSSADAVSTETQGDEVTFQAEHFSVYVIAFSYYNESNDEWYDYNLSMSTSFKVSDLLTKLGVTFSNVTSATSDTPTVLTVAGNENDTFIEGKSVGTATLIVTYDESSTITIDVTVDMASGTCGDDLTWTLSGSDDNYTLNISGSGAMYDYESSCEDEQWTSNAPWSINDFVIKALVIDEDVTSIGDGAFCGLQLTGELTIPDNVTSIGANAFSGCSGLTGNLNIPSGVTSIGANAFDGCSGLTGNLNIPSGVTSIGEGAFSCCRGLTGNLNIPSGVTSIGAYTFFECNGLNGVLTIPSGVTSIGDNAFYRCSGLTGSLIIPSGVASIGESAFYECSGLTGNLTIPSGVTSISNYAFYECSGLTGNLIIPSGVTSIGASAFSYCTGLDGNLTIPDSVELLGSDAFAGCSNLHGQVKLPASATKIGASTFAGCSSLAGELTIPVGVTEIGSNAFKNCSRLTGTLYIPDGVTVINYGAFDACTGFDKAIIPMSVTAIGEGYKPYYGSFMDWKAGSCIYNLSSVFMTSGSHYSGATLGAVYTVTTHVDGSTTAIKVPGDNEPTTAIVDPTKDGYEFLGWYTDNTLTTKWDSTKPISGNIDLYAKFEKTVASGNCGAEGDGSNLIYKITTTDNNIYTLTISGSGAMADYSDYKLVPWYAYNYQLTSLVLEEGMTKIGVNAFYACSGLKGNLTIPNSVTSIGDGAFYYCYRLTGSLTIPSGVTSIGNFAFYNCGGLTALTISSGLTSIGAGAFDWSGLTGELIIPDSVTSIGKFAFGDCFNVTKIVIPKSVTSIGDSAFNTNNKEKIYNLSDVTLTEGNHYNSADNLGTIYTVTTHVDGVDTTTKVPGDGVTTFTVADPTKANGEFLGWYTDASCTTKWDSAQLITENTNLYAKFLTTAASGNCGAVGDGSNLTYKITTTDNMYYTLTISGSGAMANYTNETQAPWYSYGSKLTSLVLKEGMTTIGDGAFYNCKVLTGSLTIPSGVTSIGDGAFHNCYNLTGSLTIPSGVTSIGDDAFLCCLSLNGSLTIPSGVTSIGDGAFCSCPGLTGSLTIPTGVTRIGDYTFSGCKGLTGSLTIPLGVTSIGDKAFMGCIGLTGSLTIPSGVTSIGYNAFQDCSGLNKIIIPKSVTSTKESAFFIHSDTLKVYNLSDIALIANKHYYADENIGTVYTVTTHVDGTVASSQKIPGDDETTVTVPDAVKDGYVFKGWYTDSTFSTDKLWNGNNNTISENLNLYAKLLKKLTVSDISGISNTGKVTYNGSKEIPVTLTLSGYDPSGAGVPISETATAIATVNSADAGTYTGYTLSNIVLDSENSSNYTLTGVTDGSITIDSEDTDSFGVIIDKAPLKVTAADVKLSAGDNMPELTDTDLTFAGFVNEEDKAVLGGTLNFTFSQNHTNSEVSNGTVTPGGYMTNNYAISYVPGKFVVTPKTFGSTPYTVSGSNNGKAGTDLWYTGDIMLTPDSEVCGNFKYISISTDGGHSYSDWSTQAVIPTMDGEAHLDIDSGSVIVKLSTAASGQEGTERAIVIINDVFNYRMDTIAPTGAITIETNIFNDFLYTITYGLLFNKNITVSIAAESSPSDLSGTTIYLYKDTIISAKAKTIEELAALSETSDVTTGWKQTGSFSVATDEQFTVYGKIVDGAGHVTYLNTEGVIVDQTAPTISDISIPVENLMDLTAGAALTADEAGTYYYVVLKSSDTAPVSAEEIAQTTALVSGSGAMGKDTKSVISFSGLTANTAYTIYATVKDAAGNYAAINQSTFTTNKTMVTIGTAPTISGYYGQQVSDMALTDGIAKVGETTIPGSWSFVSSYTDIPIVGTQTAYSVLFTPADTGTYETTVANVIPNILARSLAAAKVTVAITGTYTYTGTAIIPNVTVTDSQAVITAGDYDITYSNNIGAGENTASVTVTGKGNYTGMVTKNFSIAKADTAITVAAGSENYAKTFKDASFSLTGISKNGEGTLTYASSKPSVATVSADGTVTIKGAGTTDITVSLSATDNCNSATDKVVTVTVGKAEALSIADIAKTYVYTLGMEGESIDLSALLPEDRKDTTYHIDGINDTKTILNGTLTVNAEGMLTYSTLPGTIGDTAVINVTASMANYEDTSIKIVVNLIDKTLVDITGVTIADKTYDGETAAVTGTVSVNKTGTTKSVDIDELTYAYTSTDGKDYDSSTPPKDAGSYQLVISVPDSNKTYKGSTEPITFTIAKKAVTVKALDKEIQTGQTIPSLTNPVNNTDYSVSALVGSDKLKGTVTLQYATNVDNSKAGSTAIVIAGVTAGDNYSLSLVNGTLTIKQAESSNTGSQTTTNTDSSSSATEGTGTNQNVNGTEQGENVQQPDRMSQAEENKPYIAGDEEKRGWEAIITEIEERSGEAATDPVTLTIEMNEASIIPANVISELRGKNVNLVLDMGDGITWTINGMDVEDTQLFDINLGVSRNTSVIPENVVNGIRGKNNSIQIELAHNGAFGFTATLSIAFDSAEAGNYANMFYYNEETGKLEYMESAQISEDGTATLTFIHASAYTIVLSSEAMDENSITESESDDKNQADDSSESVTTEVQATDETSGNMMVILILLGVIVIVVIGGATIYMRKKKDETKEDKA